MARGVLYLDSCTHISKVCLEQLFVLWCVRLLKDNCQQASRAKTLGLRGSHLNGSRSIAAGRKILDRAVKSVMEGSLEI